MQNIDLSLDQWIGTAMKMEGRVRAFEMRTRLNPHHPEEDKDYERARFEEEQLKDLFLLKSAFAKHRDAYYAEAELLSKDPAHGQEGKNRLIWLKAMDRIIDDDFEQQVLMSADTESKSKT